MNQAGTHQAVSPYENLSDPLLAAVPLNFHTVLFPFGFPVNVKSNSTSVIRAAEESWGAFQQSYRTPPIEVRFVVSEIASRRRPPTPICRAQANLLTIVADANNFAACDLAAGFGFASLTKAATIHRDYIRPHFIESMVYILLDTRHTFAVHAACVQYRGRGVLLLGNSGAGKSSFAYAAARRGWAYLCDDAAVLILHKTGRTVVGNPHTIRFRPSALTLFPEISGPSKPRNGKPTIEIATERLRHVQPVSESGVDLLIFLNRSNEPAAAELTPMNRQDVLRHLATTSWPQELSIHEKRSVAIERLLGAPAFQLEYREFDPALDLLESLIHRDNS